MAKDIKIVKSKTAPVDKNVLWDDGENLKINRNGKWESANTTEIKEGSIPFSALAPLNDTDKNQALANLGINEKIDLCKGLGGFPITIDYNNPGTFTFEEYGISIEQSNILLLAYFGVINSNENADIALNTLINEINRPNFDTNYNNTQFDNRFKISYVYVRYEYNEEYEEDYEVSFGYNIDLKNKEIKISK